jgi:hypothetical protein
MASFCETLHISIQHISPYEFTSVVLENILSRGYKGKKTHWLPECLRGVGTKSDLVIRIRNDANIHI